MSAPVPGLLRRIRLRVAGANPALPPDLSLAVVLAISLALALLWFPSGAVAQMCLPQPGGSPCEAASGAAGRGDVNGSAVPVGNPIHPITGNKYQEEVDAAPLPGELGLEIRRHYNAHYVADDAPAGRGWRLSYETRLYRTGARLQIVQADGRRVIFRAPGADGRPTAGEEVECEAEQIGEGRLVASPDGYRWIWPERRELRFDRDGRLVRIARVGAGDREAVRITHDAFGRITSVIDPAGRTLSLVYDAAGRLLRIDHPLGSWRYRITAEGQVQSVTAPDGSRRHYRYGDIGHRFRITEIQAASPGGDPRVVGRWGYDSEGRAVRHERSDGTVLSLEYRHGDREAGPGATRTTVLTNALGHITRYRAEEVAGHWRVIEVMGPGCDECGPTQWRARYDARGQLRARWRIGGEGVAYQRDAAGRVVRIFRLLDPDARGWQAGVDRRATAPDMEGASRRSATAGATPSRKDRTNRPVRGATAAAPSPTPPAIAPAPSLGEWILGYEYADDESTLPSAIVRPSVVAGRLHRIRYLRDDRGREIARIETGYAPSLDGPPIALERRTDYRYALVEGRNVLVSVDGPLPNGPAQSPADSDILRFVIAPGSGLVDGIDAPGDRRLRIVDRDAGGRPLRVVATDGSRQLEEIVQRDLQGRWTRRVVRGLASGPSDLPQPELVETRRFVSDGLEMIDAAGRSVIQRLDARGHLAAVLDGTGHAARFERDAEGRTRRIGLHRPGAEHPLRAATLERSPEGRMTALQRPDGQLWKALVDGGGHIAGWFDGERARLGMLDVGLDGLVRLDRRREATVAWDDFGRRVGERLPDHGLRTVAYDLADRITEARDGAGVAVRFEHDVAGRLLRAVREDGVELAAYRYDGMRAIAVDTPEARTRITHDALGRVVERRIAFTGLGARWFLTRTDFDPASGLVIGRTLADGSRLIVDRTPAAEGATVRRLRLRGAGWTKVEAVIERTVGRLSGGAAAWLRDALPAAIVADDIRIDPFNGLVGFAHGNGVRMERTLDPAGRLVQVDLARKSTLLLGQRIRYDRASRVSAIQLLEPGAQATPPTREFTYDSFGRLRTAFDRVGTNRWPVSGLPALPSAPLVSTFDTASHKTAAAASGSSGTAGRVDLGILEGAGRDTAGRLTRDARFRYGYTVYGQLATVDRLDDTPVARYAYDDRRRRFAKTTFGPDGSPRTRHFLWDGSRLAAEIDERGNVAVQYLYLDDGLQAIPIAQIESDGRSETKVLALHVDHRGAPVAATDAKGRPVWRARLTPNGAAEGGSAHQTQASRDVSAPPRPDTVLDRIRLRLPGQYVDSETGLHDNGHRTYDPELGRYLQPDPLGYPDGPDPYAYASGNPMSKVDATGLYETDVHYYMTFFLAVTAGHSVADARQIALAAQYIDDNPMTKPVDDANTLTTVLSIFHNHQQLRFYHFVLSDENGVTLPQYRNSNLDVLDSPQLQHLWEVAHRPTLSRQARLILLGDYIHALQDTFSHRDMSNVPYDAFQLGCGVGHGAAGHDPDKTHDEPDDEKLLSDPEGRPDQARWTVREHRTLRMEEVVFTQLSQTQRAGRAAEWSQIEETLRAFNKLEVDPNARENEKIRLLNEALASLGYAGIDLAGAQAYSEVEASSAREQYLRNADGSPLNEAEYENVCLPGGTTCKPVVVNRR